MKLLVLDAETYFDQDYSLKKLSTEEYVRSPLFKAHMWGCWAPDRMAAPAECKPEVLETHDDFRALVEDSAVLCHHAHFDGLILEHHYGLKPRFWLDTLSIARLALPALRSHSLDALASHFGLPAKSVPYNEFRGVRDVVGPLYSKLADGCKHDVWLTKQIFDRLIPYVPRDELKVIDATVRMFTEPTLRLDRPRMTAFLQAERIRKAKAMLQAGAAMGMHLPAQTTPDILRQALALIETELQSAEKFRMALEALGYPCPTKWSDKAKSICADCNGSGEPADLRPTGACSVCAGTGQQKGGYIPALAKNDDGMKELLEHDDVRVQTLAAARLGVKSTIDETRAGRLLDSDARGPLPVYLAYAAAHTLRFGGGDKTNWQNFRRGGEIRRSIVAPEGHKIVVGDASQIEYRLSCYVAGQQDKLDALAAGRDLYCEFATKMYGIPVTKEDKARRGCGKQGMLMGQYGAGKGTMISTAAGGGYGPPVHLSDAEGQRMVDVFREDHPMLCGKGGFWSWCASIHAILADGGETSYRNGLLRIANHRIWFPNGTCLNYEGMRWASNVEIFPEQNPDDQGYSWWRPIRKGWTRMWGSKTTADIIQGLAAVFIKEIMVRTINCGWKPALQVHDELLYVVPDAVAGPVTPKEVTAAEAQPGTLLHGLLQELVTPPVWLAGIPLAAEGLTRQEYAK